VLYYSRSYLSTDETVFKLRLRQLVRAFERRGHEYADLDPLGLQVRPEAPPELDPAAYGFTAADLQRTVVVQPFDGLKGLLGKEGTKGTLLEVLDSLQKRYTGTVGVEYMHLRDASRSTWLRDRVEDYDDRAGYWSKEDKLQILDRVAYVCVSV
jgi:2-oxoglutarate dehydrogenase E1 component